MDADATVALLDVIRALAFVGDLAMGQPTNHSLRTARIAGMLAKAANGDDVLCAETASVALLRWSGCTANAPEFAQWFGDDIGGRNALLALTASASGLRSGTESESTAFLSLSRIHCEASGEIAELLGLSEEAQFALRHLFESYDGNGAPDGLGGDRVPPSVYMASLAGDLEIFSRLYGIEQACHLLKRRADTQYPADLVAIVILHASQWLQSLDEEPSLEDACVVQAAFAGRTTSLEILADVVDLKLPWMTGHSRRVATLARETAINLNLDHSSQQRAYRSALIHGVGRAAVPNMIWDTPGKLQGAAWERVRLVPYWTARAARQIGSLAAEATLASYAYERLDGSGYYREAEVDGMPIEARILAAATAFSALVAPRPWRGALGTEEAANQMRAEAAAGRFDMDVVRALLADTRKGSAQSFSSGILSERERQVLHWISNGASNKAVALKLSISPSTVRTHVESVFRKLGCSTRAAATLKAAQLGLL
jgi:HD-GYP domain-containing protein (c-di-GMP phosphodiesterase class II)